MVFLQVSNCYPCEVKAAVEVDVDHAGDASGVLRQQKQLGMSLGRERESNQCFHDSPDYSPLVRFRDSIYLAPSTLDALSQQHSR